MRPIEFRAIAKGFYKPQGGNKQSGVNDGDWVYGHYFTVPCHDDDRCVFLFATCIRMSYGDHSADIEIDSATLGQYTGLKDKDGVKIFEGDILFLKTGHHERKTKAVKWSDSSACFCVYDGLALFGGSGCEVIGNIYENPELLEQSK